MANLKLKIKKAKMVRTIEGTKTTGYYGRVITNGTKSFEDIVKQSTHGSALLPARGLQRQPTIRCTKKFLSHATSLSR